MRIEANRNRDPFRFSQIGMAAINPYVIVPTAPDDTINRAWDDRLQHYRQHRAPESRSRTLRGLENLLARYFAPGRRQAA